MLHQNFFQPIGLNTIMVCYTLGLLCASHYAYESFGINKMEVALSEVTGIWQKFFTVKPILHWSQKLHWKPFFDFFGQLFCHMSLVINYVLSFSLISDTLSVGGCWGFFEKWLRYPKISPLSISAIFVISRVLASLLKTFIKFRWPREKLISKSHILSKRSGYMPRLFEETSRKKLH